MSAWAVGSFLLMLVAVPLIVNEAGELAPWLAARLVEWGASLLGSAEARERYAEEWPANLECVPGKITKLAWACGVLLWGVPRMRIQVRSRERGVSAAASEAKSGRALLPRSDLHATEERFHSVVLAQARAMMSSVVGPAEAGGGAANLLFDKNIKLWETSDGASQGKSSSMMDYYQSLSPGRLVVLGGPGAGKTVLALELQVRLLEAWTKNSSTPIPVLVHAAS
jgi:hypothetical protein